MEDLEKELETQEKMMKSGEHLKKVSNIIHEKRVDYAKKRELKLRKFKAKVVGVSITATFILGSLVGHKIGKDKGYEEGYNTATNVNYDGTYSLYDAPDSLLAEWAYAVRNQNITDDDIRQNANNVIESYTRYINLKSNNIEAKVLEENNIVNPYVKEYSEFKYQINMLDDNLSTSYIYQKYSFDESLYSKSKVIDDIIYIPYTGDMNNIPEGATILEDKIYIQSPYNYKHNLEEEINEENSYSK